MRKQIKQHEERHKKEEKALTNVETTNADYVDAEVARSRINVETAEYSRSVTPDDIGKYADTTSGIVTTSDVDPEVGKVNIADKMDADRHTTSGKKVLCSFFLFENPDDALPDMDCGFEASNGHMLGEHFK